MQNLLQKSLIGSSRAAQNKKSLIRRSGKYRRPFSIYQKRSGNEALSIMILLIGETTTAFFLTEKWYRLMLINIAKSLLRDSTGWAHTCKKKIFGCWTALLLKILRSSRG